MAPMATTVHTVRNICGETFDAEFIGCAWRRRTIILLSHPDPSQSVGVLLGRVGRYSSRVLLVCASGGGGYGWRMLKEFESYVGPGQKILVDADRSESWWTRQGYRRLNGGSSQTTRSGRVTVPTTTERVEMVKYVHGHHIPVEV